MMFSIMNPAMFTGSFAEENGGAYARSSSAKSDAVIPARMAVAKTSILFSTPSRPMACAPITRPVPFSNRTLSVMLWAPG